MRKRLHRSIHTRILCWYTLLMILIVAGMMVAVHDGRSGQLVAELDLGLDEYSASLLGPAGSRRQSARGEGSRRRRPGDGGPRGGPRRQRPPGEGTRREQLSTESDSASSNRPLPPHRSSREQRKKFEQLGYYQVRWYQGGGEELSRSETAPADIEYPGRHMRLRRTRDGMREFISVGPNRTVGLCGISMDAMREQLRVFAWKLGGVGALIVAGSVFVGWWILRIGLSPIQSISDSAQLIAEGDLKKRIDVTKTSTELEALAGTLNDTFDHLGTALERQIRFTADASHELRTPVAVVLAEAQSALKRERTAEEYRERFETCLYSARHMRGLINSLMELARIDAGESKLAVEPGNLATLATETVDLIRPIATQKSVTIETDFDPSTCNADQDKIRQVFVNLLINAVQHTPVGTIVKAVTGILDGRPFFRVSDQGEGVAEEDIPYLFDRFYRADKARTGESTGLGLAISNAIVVAHSGEISISSVEPSGAQFTVWLPAS